MDKQTAINAILANLSEGKLPETPVSVTVNQDILDGVIVKIAIATIVVVALTVFIIRIGKK